MGIIAHGTVGPGCRKGILADHLKIVIDAELDNISFPEIAFQGFKECQINFVAAHGLGNRDHRGGVSHILGQNAVDGCQQYG